LASFLLGWHLQPILSGSMRPTYPAGALVAVEPIDASEVRPGMVIVFADPLQPGRLVAHRVVEQVSGDRLAFRTRGDANVSDDPFPVSGESVRGRIRWGIPGLGSVVAALDGGWGAALLIGAPAGTLVGTEGFDVWRRRRHRQREPEAPDGQ
jgi:signal peptidase